TRAEHLARVRPDLIVTAERLRRTAGTGGGVFRHVEPTYDWAPTAFPTRVNGHVVKWDEGRWGFGKVDEVLREEDGLSLIRDGRVITKVPLDHRLLIGKLRPGSRDALAKMAELTGTGSVEEYN